MKTTVALLVKILVVFLIPIHFIANATNGYFSHGKSIIEKSQAGAGVAQINTNYGLSNNPAQLSNEVEGLSFEIGFALFSPDREYTVQGQPSISEGIICGNQCPFSIGKGNQNIKSSNSIFVIPQFGIHYKIDDKSHATFSIFANGGMNTNYRGGVAYIAPQGVATEFKGTYGNGNTGVDLAQMFAAMTYSHSLLDNSLALGGSIIYAYQQIEIEGVSAFAGFSLNPTALSNQGVNRSNGVGWRVGMQYKIDDDLTLAGAYQAKIKMSKFDKYAGLFANNGEFDIPSNWTLGLAYLFNAKDEILLDYETIQYSDVASIGHSIDSLMNGNCIPGVQGGNGSGCLGGVQGAGFGWIDMRIIKLAYKWQFSNNLILRAGISKTSQPIAKKEILFAILTPAVIEKHFTLGASYQLPSKSKLHFSLMYAPKNKMLGSNRFDPAQQVSVEMSQIELGFSYQGRW